MRRNVGRRKFAIGALVNHDGIGALGREQDDAGGGGTGVADQYAIRAHMFVAQEILKSLAMSVAPDLAHEMGFRAQPRRRHRHVGALAAMGGVEIAAHHGLAFDGQAVHVHHQGDDIAADNDHPAHMSYSLPERRGYSAISLIPCTIVAVNMDYTIIMSGVRASHFHTPSRLSQSLFHTVLRAGHLETAPDYAVERLSYPG